MKCRRLERHHYIIDKKYDASIMKLKCSKCQKTFGVNLDSQLLVAWNEHMEHYLSIYENNLIDDFRLENTTEDYKIMYA
ncbi:MAG: hypothetical protein HKP38_06440 [Croceitalea sp.]|nr:hypothetical protein [Croceitalea sp.]MBT8237229.1 hypothetical protein [Croceitalea sp.]NNC34918.1 hypothetical protein [Croceitalea sp.]NNL08845.1 hypothetical protein [Croceitalea sp.]NNM18160.1 hypothetical protein [Croceitalea sp.]